MEEFFTQSAGGFPLARLVPGQWGQFISLIAWGDTGELRRKLHLLWAGRNEFGVFLKRKKRVYKRPFSRLEITLTKSCRQHLVLEILVMIVPPGQISFDLMLLNQIKLEAGSTWQIDHWGWDWSLGKSPRKAYCCFLGGWLSCWFPTVITFTKCWSTAWAAPF